MIDLGPLDSRIDLATGRSLPKCRHFHAEPVTLLLTGELVAWLCVDCDEQLAADFQPPDPRVEAALRGVMSPDDVRRELWAARAQAVKERFGGA